MQAWCDAGREERAAGAAPPLAVRSSEQDDFQVIEFRQKGLCEREPQPISRFAAFFVRLTLGPTTIGPL